MRTAINKKRIVLYAVCAFFFCLAGVFQAVDSSLPDFWHALFALLAHTILISLVVAWGVSLIHRMVRKDLRAYFITVAVLILFFLVVRMIRYGLTKDTDALSRYLWYAYYVPRMFIPPTILLAAFSIESKKGKPLAKAWYFLYLPAVILLLLIFTNDAHEWAFALNFENGFSYEHRTVYYIALAWEIAVTFTSLIVLILKCGISACRRKTWIPVTVFIVCVAVSTVCFLTDTPAFKTPELLCFTCIVMIESCIAIGLIPSNDEYENYFYRSAYSAVITDENLSVIYDSEKSISTDKNLLGRAAKSPVMIDENTRLSAEKIHGGYIFRIEDLSKVNEINAALSETNERLSEENYIIEAENELKEQKAQIAEQNKLYAKTDEVTCEELKRLDALLSDMYHKTQLNSTEYIDKMRFACILAAYIKRRSNLVMLAEKQENIDVGELSLAIKESLGFLSLTGAECTFDCAVSGKIYDKNAGVFYDFFQACIANYEGLPSAVIVRLSRRGDNLVLRIECDNKAKEISEKVKSKFEKYNVTIQTDDEEVYYSLTLPEGGAV